MIKQYAEAYNEVICMLMEHAQNVVNANGAALEVVENNYLTYMSVSGVLEPLLGTQVPFLGEQTPPSNTFSSRCVATKAPLSCSNISTNPDASVARAIFKGIPIGSMILIPILSQEGDKVKAVLKLTSEEEKHFCAGCEEEHMSRLSLLSSSISAAMLDAEVYAEKKEKTFDETSNATMERFYHHLLEDTKDIKRSLLIFDTLCNMIKDGVFVTNIAGDCVYTNPSYQKLRDMTEEETLNQGWVTRVHQDDIKIMEKMWEHSVQFRTEFQFRFRCFDKLGTLRTLNVHSAPLIKHGEIFGHIGIVEIPQND